MGDAEKALWPAEGPDTPGENSGSREMLRSWKDIAAYLQISVRAAQVWEKDKGLPVRRLGSAARSPVVADPMEIDRWLRSQTSGKAAENTRKAEEPVPAEPVRQAAGRPLPAVEPNPWSRGRIWIGAAALLLAAAAGWFFLSRPAIPSRLVVDQKRFQLYGEDGVLLWEKEFPKATNNYLPFSNNAYHFLIEDIDGDGSREILFAPPMEDSLDLPTSLLCFSSRGELRWEFVLGHKKILGEREFGVKYSVSFLFAVQSGGKRYILSVAENSPWFPTQAALLDVRTGRLVDEYWHPGHINSGLVRDIDADGIPEAVLGGFNHPNQGIGYPGLVVLKIPFAKKPVPAGEPSYSLRSFSGGQEEAYYLLPRTDMAERLQALTMVEVLSVDQENHILATTISLSHDTSPYRSAGHLIYRLDSRFRILDLWPADDHYVRHDELFRAGKLDHRFDEQERRSLMKILSFPTTPNGNAPEIDALWLQAGASPAP